PIRRTPICLLQREQLEAWLGLAGGITRPEPTGTAREVYEVLTARGALFFPELSRAVKLPQAYLEVSLSELIGLGHVTCDSFGGEQYALPEAVTLLREARRAGAPPRPATVSSADPLNFAGILTPGEKVPMNERAEVLVG